MLSLLFYKLTIILTCTFLTFTISADINLQTCINNFDIHRDKIIRTQDSRAMGAKYLNEIDLDSRDECLRLCCETDDCDVFVYEEKNSGSCYLFHCGPPEDFKCKFTHHVNYTSAVLAVSRHLPDLESQIKLTKHEQDLTKLRKQEILPQVIQQLPETQTAPPTVPTTTTSTTPPPPSQKELLTIAKSAPEPARKCSRYQFECRSTSDCIAIYNACDGIPQCADGSDEAPELGCPDSATTPISVRSGNSVVPAFIPVDRVQSSLTSTSGRNFDGNVQNSEIYRPSVMQQHVADGNNNPVKEADFIRPMMDGRASMNSRQEYDAASGQISQYPQFAQQQQQASGNPWIPHQSNQMPPQYPNYIDKSHIFNHKETGLQVPDGQESSPVQYQDVNNHEYAKLPSYYGDVYRQQQLPQLQEHWPINGQEEIYNPPYNQESNIPKRGNWHTAPIPIEQPQQQQQPPPAAAVPQPLYQEQKSSNVPAWKQEVAINPKHEQEKMAHELKEHSKQQEVNDNNIKATHDDGNNVKTIKIEKHVTRNQHEMIYSMAEKYKMEEETLDGIAEAPSGAILSLTLGLIITCVMAILIGCRLRVVKRRMRRGGKSYAHDADYLVNGMYL